MTILQVVKGFEAVSDTEKMCVRPVQPGIALTQTNTFICVLMQNDNRILLTEQMLDNILIMLQSVKSQWPDQPVLERRTFDADE